MNSSSQGLALSGAVLAITLLIMNLLNRKNHFQVAGRTVLVTGGSQGMGLSVAKQLATKGANVVIVARDPSKLRKAIEEISSVAQSPKQRFHYLSYDLCDPKSAPKIVAEVTTWNNNPPDILFSCAGYADTGFFASTPIQQHRDQMDTTYWSCVYIAHAILNSWILPSKKLDFTRHIVFTSSVAALLPLAGYAPYTPGKAAMRALADTLNQEVAVYNGARESDPSGPPADIKVHIIFPMGISSPGLENENKTKPKLTMMLEKDDIPESPDSCARTSIKRLEAGDFLITTSFLGNLLRGMGLGSSMRNGLIDILWNIMGSIAILFVAPDFMSKCRKWGKEKGMNGAK